jgi:hypothetical protein
MQNVLTGRTNRQAGIHKQDTQTSRTHRQAGHADRQNTETFRTQTGGIHRQAWTRQIGLHYLQTSNTDRYDIQTGRTYRQAGHKHAGHTSR